MKTYSPCSPLAVSNLSSMFCRPARGRRARRGALLVETLAAVLILTFLVWATARFYIVGIAQQRLGQGYSQAQTNIRTALRSVTRTIRHGYAVVPSVSSGNLNGKTSTTSQIIVTVPQATGSPTINILFYVSNGTLYYQRSTDTSPTVMITGVQSLTLTYYKTSLASSGTGTTQTQVNSTPGSATEVQINLVANYQNVTTTVTAYTTLRNMIAGSF